MSEPKELNPKQDKFCRDYVLNGENGKQAAISAGYSSSTADVQASRLLTHVKVSQRIAELKREVASVAHEEFMVDAKWVMKRLFDISNRCMTAEPVMAKVDGILIETGEYQFDSSGANKSTELLGKIIGVFEKDNSQKTLKIKVGYGGK